MSNDITRLSNTEVVILKMMIGLGGELYGNEMIKQSDGRLKRGTIYVMLGRMEDKGFVESRKETKQPNIPGLPRRLYQPTALGQRALADWEFSMNPVFTAVKGVL